MDEKELKKNLIADRMSLIIGAYTRPKDLTRFIGDDLKDGGRIRMIVEATLIDGFPIFKSIEFRVREDTK